MADVANGPSVQLLQNLWHQDLQELLLQQGFKDFLLPLVPL